MLVRMQAATDVWLQVQLRRGQHERARAAAAASVLSSPSSEAAAPDSRLSREAQELMAGAWSFEPAE